MQNPQYIIVMKIGPYCGYPLKEIIDIKQEEERKVGKFFIGYSGVFCRPKVVNNLVNHSINHNESIKVLFIETKSSYDNDNAKEFNYFSKDGELWQELSDEILLVGDTNKKHFAITGKNLKKVNYKLDLTQYCTLMGMFPNKDQYLDNYLKYRVDKACGYYFPRESVKEKKVDISYMCDLVDPYCVYIKE